MKNGGAIFFHRHTGGMEWKRDRGSCMCIRGSGGGVVWRQLFVALSSDAPPLPSAKKLRSV